MAISAAPHDGEARGQHWNTHELVVGIKDRTEEEHTIQ
jgi:hypothetical protein